MKEIIIYLFAALCFPLTKHLQIYSKQDNKVQYEFSHATATTVYIST